MSTSGDCCTVEQFLFADSSLSLCTDDNLRLRENVQARLDEKTTEFDNLLKQKTQLDRDYQMLSHKVKESEKKAFERIVA